MPERMRGDGEQPTRVRWKTLLGGFILALAGLAAWRAPQRPPKDPLGVRDQRHRSALVARLRRIGHEPNDVSVAAIAALGVAAILVAIGMHLALCGLFNLYVAAPPTAAPLAQMNAPLAPSAPTVTAVPVSERVYFMPSDWQELRAQQEATLHGYGWVDEQAGIAHIPIERAIDLLVERGLPVRDQR